MANSITLTLPVSSQRTYTLTVTETETSDRVNASVVTYTLTSSGTASGLQYYLKATINGTQIWNSSGGAGSSFPSTTGSKTGTLGISHNADGTKTIVVWLEASVNGGNIVTDWENFQLTTLNRTPPEVSASVSNITTSSMRVNVSTMPLCVQCSWRYKKSGGEYGEWFYQDGYADSYTINLTGLASNTTYAIQVSCKAYANYVWGYASTVTGKTLGASTITSVDAATLGSACSVTWTPASSSYKYRLRFTLGEWAHSTDYISPNRTSAYTYTGYTIPLSVANQLPSATSGTMTVALHTYTSGGTQVGSSSSKTFKVTIPSSVVPTISSVAIAEGTKSGFNEYVKTLSSVKTTTTAAGVYSSTIESIVMTVDGKSYTANSSKVATSDIFSTYGTKTVKVVVTDSRNRKATWTQSITVYNYFKPTAAIDIDVTGDTVVTTVSGKIASVNSLNSKKLVITRKRMSDSTTTTYTVDPLSAYNYSAAWTQTIADIDTESYQYTAKVTDSKQTVTVTRQTAVVCISRLRGGRGVTLFKEATEEGFWVSDVNYTITKAEFLSLAESLAANYSNIRTYFVGEFCIRSGGLYRCISSISTAESWNAAHWELLGEV